MILLAALCAALAAPARAIITQSFLPPELHRAPILVQEPSAEGRTTLGASDEGRAVELKAGALLEIRLTASAGTGYAWTLGSADRDVLELADGSPRVEDGSPIPGGPQTFVFLFTAKAPGRADVVLRLKRPWEDAPARSFLVTLVVR